MSGHNHVEIDPNQPYEKNEVGVKGVIYFGIGLFLLIIVTFVLMYLFQYSVLQPQFDEYDAAAKSPVALSEEERLPPEPRLQSAPGFGVDSKDGRINLELSQPQAEYWELEKQWKDVWENGEKRIDPATKQEVVVSLPIEAAKEKVLSSGSLKSAANEKGAAAFEEATTKVSTASGGRTRVDRIR